MPITHHDDIELQAGDDWVIAGTLNDDTGTAIDLTQGAMQFMWTLIDPDGLACAAVQAASIAPDSTTGTSGGLNIRVPRQATEGLDAGRYHDALRALFADGASMMWVGAILIDCDPFLAGLAGSGWVMLAGNALAGSAPALGAPDLTT
jgi:hypothetical protein